LICLSLQGLSELLPHLVYGPQLEKMVNQHTSADAILKWIQDNLSQDTTEDTLFCRLFVKCVLQQILPAASQDTQILQVGLSRITPLTGIAVHASVQATVCYE